ncbi:MAG: helix-turn-helix domain-containing protein [Eubacteriales bacterium]|nr:helix-turn-helix domain-containing protein [Eubacteriales bacterium]
MNIIGEKIAELRKAKGMTQEELASVIGVSSQSVSKWENSTTMPDIMLLPVLADTLGVTVDTLFGKSRGEEAFSADDVFASACEGLLRSVACACHDKSKPFDARFAEYVSALKDDDRMRSAVIRKHGIVYYREEIGGLLLKRPRNGWSGLTGDISAQKTLALLADRDFCRALHAIVRTNMTAFTIPSLCGICGAEDAGELEQAIAGSGLFARRKIAVDGQTVVVYELFGSHKLFLIFAIFTYAKELAEYSDVYYNYYGDGNFYTG